MRPKLRGLGAMVLILGLLAPAPDDKAETLRKETKALEGQWLLTKSTVRGTVNPRQGRVRYFFDGSYYIQSAGYAVIAEGEFTIDPTKEPKAIDFVPSIEGRAAIKGIYKLEGDVLTLCTTAKIGQRPQVFESKRGSADMLYEFKRVKD